jgi:dolichyl-phosphate beta-glucosyltransferase
MNKQTISIVIPAYNESEQIKDSLALVRAYTQEQDAYNWEIIVVDDGSTDDTAELISHTPNIQAITYTPNKGKGYALRTGVQKAIGDYIYICDADLAVSIDQIEQFLEQMPGYDCIIGSKQIAGASLVNSPKRKLLSKIGNALISTLLGLHYSDTQCGFKLLNHRARDIFLTHTTDRWGFDFDFLLRAEQDNLTIKEIPISCRFENNSQVNIRAYFTTLILTAL